MAFQTDNTLISNREMFGELVATAFSAIRATISSAFVSFFTAGPRMTALKELNETSDAELEAKGLTRAQAAQQIFGSYI